MAETKGFYVGVKEPVSLRRSLLESSKSVIQGLKDYEKLKSIREERHKKILEFRDKISEVLVLISELKENLPKKELEKRAYAKVETKKTKKGTEKKAKIKIDDIERLEHDLAEIESRLGRM